ncbi:TrmJ/YjtD family RNA methyltransferase [Candidatus Woesearchaeota archaeon]|nr:TrmJ/YjtD family RNA methyltransferase [Candidatus Woesearchaeota archaeon]
MIYTILLEPEHPGNVGAVCRAMANFGFRDLVVINPLCDMNSEELICRAKHAKKVISRIKVRDRSFLTKLDLLIGTTSKLGTDYNIPRSPLLPEHISKKIVVSEGNIGLLFGREGIGLTNEEISLCDFVLSIATSKDYPALNLSHAVSIILYELSKSRELRDGGSISGDQIHENIELSSRKYKDVLYDNICRTLDCIDFKTDDKHETQKTVWKRIIGKSFLTKREAFALIGYFKKIYKKIK